jgi:hypothetical protein
VNVKNNVTSSLILLAQVRVGVGGGMIQQMDRGFDGGFGAGSLGSGKGIQRTWSMVESTALVQKRRRVPTTCWSCLVWSSVLIGLVQSVVR